jgi:hypothetical protein
MTFLDWIFLPGGTALDPETIPSALSMDRMEGQRRRRDGGKDEGLAVNARVVG